MSQKLAQVLKIDPPHELKFQGPFKDVVTSHLRLTNPSGRKVCFKVKTTAPRRYCVRPNSGVVDSQSNVNISVMLQPFDSDPNELLKHKFMIQTMFAPEIVDDLEALWKDVQPSDLMDSKLRCVFEQPAPDTSLPDPVSSSNPSSLAQGSELQAIMEENRRLQAENAKLRLDNEELLGRPVSGSGKQGEDLMTKQKRLIIIFLLLAFVTGITLGYILS